MGGKSKKKNKKEQQKWSGPPPPGLKPPVSEGESKASSVDDAVSSGTRKTTIPPEGVTSATAFVMECDVCQERFDHYQHKPRNLHCGHCFCTYCCSLLIQGSTIICPKCRKSTPAKDCSDLAVNYPVLEMLEKRAQCTKGSGSVKEGKDSSWMEYKFSDHHKKGQASPHGGKCLEAQAELAMHCAHCDLWLCRDCSLIDHQCTECVLMPYQDTLREMSQTGKVKLRATQETLEKFYCEADAYGSKLRSCTAILEIVLNCMKTEQDQLPGVFKHCKKFMEDLSELAVQHVPTAVEEALPYLNTLEAATQMTNQWMTNVSTNMLKTNQVFRLSKTLLQTAVQMHTTTSGAMMGLHSINGTQVTLPIENDGSRLLVHAPQRRAPTQGTRLVQLKDIQSCIDFTSTLTFLDLSLRGHELGRVFIRLLGSSKRSRSFLMMCTGETGLSFKNTSFHRVWWAGQPGEHLWAGDYDHGDGSGGSLHGRIQDHIKDLPNKKTCIPVVAGLVAARCGDTNSTIFRVYTRDSTDVVEEYAFGRVEYGLQVFQVALKKHNKCITDLKISGCGVVVEP